MTGEQTTTIITISVIAAVLLSMSVLLLMGKGSFLVAGLNTMPREKKEKYNIPAICKFTGLLLIVVTFCSAGITLGLAFEVMIVTYISAGIMAAFIVFGLVYVNLSSRFRNGGEE